MAVITEYFEKEKWFKVSNCDKMRPFFMSIVSDTNHWMFISSNGGLTAGRKNPKYALFPYYTDDKITESADITGSKTIFRVTKDGAEHIWEPFSERFLGKFKVSRNLYKSYTGNKILFEETNHDLNLTFRYQWNSSNRFGFVRKAELMNLSENDIEVTLLDGIQNILPYGVDPDLQVKSSNLVDAYKRNEIIEKSGIGIFALSAIIVDKAEPSEALKANIAWSTGLDKPEYLLSSLQLQNFRLMEGIKPEKDIKGEKGAYFVHATVKVGAGESKKWRIIANVNQTQADVISLDEMMDDRDGLDRLIDEDIQMGTQNLIGLVAGADGLRKTSDELKDARHFSNVMFNIMRGGTIDFNYQIEKDDFTRYLFHTNNRAHERNRQVLEKLQSKFNVLDLYKMLEKSDDPDFRRICKEYLPLKFSRRHGDPSRPWNQFSINTNSEVDGSKILDYEGNWRDIFQNWEALVHSYPVFIEGMVYKFLNNSTFDGYNPYRITKDGFDWEVIEPDNPWSYIGYWGDHQIIYLLKFLEFYRDMNPEALKSLFNRNYFVYANVPYQIVPYADIVNDPKSTILFDEKLDTLIRERREKMGADGALLFNQQGDIHRVNFLEKIFATVLSKISNFIPEAGIWLNTQRPEWNDANNALVGNGVSMVTLYYLRRFLKFMQQVLKGMETNEVEVSDELKSFFNKVFAVLMENRHVLSGPISDADRKKITDGLGLAGSEYRWIIYEKGFSGKKSRIAKSDFVNLVDVSLEFMEHSIKANRREDNLYHTYNLLSYRPDGISIEYLYEMLEGQVAVLSSGSLSSKEEATVLDALRKSALYRKDQNSYILYPNKDLPKFLERNNIPESLVKKSALLVKLLEDNDRQIIIRNIRGGHHFNGNFRNASDLRAALNKMKSGPYAELVDQDFGLVLDIYEQVFNHKAFTGRSGTFFAFEGLGSIYWHMVSKLHLAVEESCNRAAKGNADEDVLKKLFSHFREIEEGIGVHKTPELYGAFPTDAYSHTPWHRGAQQPGMTGQVKEDILAGFGELGLSVEKGILSFQPYLLRKSAFLGGPATMNFVNVNQETEEINVPANALCFSICQIPVIYQLAEEDRVHVHFQDKYKRLFNGLKLDKETSSEIFLRTGKIRQVTVCLKSSHLK